MTRIAIIGATGAVGSEFGHVFSDRNLPHNDVVLLASSRSAGRELDWAGRRRVVQALEPGSFEGITLAFFSAGASVSREFVPHARAAGALVIDNTSAYRMEPDVPLVVPEINPEAARQHRGLIANPNCSTIIVAMAVWPLHRQCPVRRMVVSTYQAVSGAGQRARAELESQTRAMLAGTAAQPEVFSEPCAFNVFSHDSPVGRDGFNVEEAKLVHETRKIFGSPELRVAPTCVRVPVMRAHTAALALEFTAPLSEAEARRLLSKAPGVEVVDDRERNDFPTPAKAANRDEILVGRIRQDPSIPDGRGLQLLCSGDQLRKGAALNAVQIVELLDT